MESRVRSRARYNRSVGGVQSLSHRWIDEVDREAVADAAEPDPRLRRGAIREGADHWPGRIHWAHYDTRHRAPRSLPDDDVSRHAACGARLGIPAGRDNS